MPAPDTELVEVVPRGGRPRDESREQAILDAAIDSIIVIDRDLTILEASPGTQSLHGVPAEDRVGRKVYELVNTEDREMVRTAFTTAFENDGAVRFRTRMNHLDGHLVTIDVRGRTLRDSDRPPTRLVFIARDISDAVAWETACDDPLTIYPITAYDAPRPRPKRKRR